MTTATRIIFSEHHPRPISVPTSPDTCLETGRAEWLLNEALKYPPAHDSDKTAADAGRFALTIAGFRHSRHATVAGV
jgi:hypothetical protein